MTQTTQHEMAWLVIASLQDGPPHWRFSVAADGGKTISSLQALTHVEIAEYALWLGKVAAREVLDAFECQLINEGLLWVRPVFPDDSDCAHLEGSFDAVGIAHADEGLRIVWQHRWPCENCNWGVRIEPSEAEITEADLCEACDGVGSLAGEEITTDYEGFVLDVALI